MTMNIFVLKRKLNGENRSGAFLFLSSICSCQVPSFDKITPKQGLMMLNFIDINCTHY